MSFGLIPYLLGLALIVFVLLKSICIIPECPQCKKVGEITDSNVKEAWLDCRCIRCGFMWRIE